VALAGSEGVAREVNVESPFDGRTLHTFALRAGGVATSGIGRRSWLDGEGRPAHHLLDPSSGRPAFTGIVQATAIAPSALRAETRAKAALLSGPRRAPAWLAEGGVIVLDDGSHHVVEPAQTLTVAELSPFAGAA
jgi:thiamine biosynthesis lipoprotein